MVGETIRMALTAIRANQFRALLTTLGVIIGVAAVIATTAIGNGAAVQIQRQISALGTNLLMIEPARPKPGGVAASAGSGTSLTLADAAALDGADSAIAAVAPEQTGSFQIIAGRENTNTQVIGTTPAFSAIRGYPIAIGRFLAPSDVLYSRPVVVLGATTAENLFGATNPVGRHVTIGPNDLEVIGVLQAKGVAGPENRDDLAIVPISFAQERLVGGQTIQRIDVEAASPSRMADAVFAIRLTLRDRHHLAATQADDFVIRNQQDLLDTSSQVSTTFTELLAGIAIVSLMVGGIGIMNIMLVSVTERTREIGIRKAVGATADVILAQFLVEALLLSLGGGLLGIGAGIGVAALLTKIAGWTTVVEPGSAALAFAVAGSIGLFFGIYPAQRAARLDPIEALRYE
jgi:putative ABC transport system permease protein